MLSSSFSSMALSEEPVLTFVPTGVTISGRKNVQDMERMFISQVRNASIEPVQVLSTYSTGNGYVEEAILRLAHEECIDWLLPDVKPTRKSIMLPIVMISQLSSTGSLMSKRFYWDQGSVLKQLGLIPSSTYCKSNKSEVKLPVLDARIINTLKETVMFEETAVPAMTDRAGLSSEAAHLAAMGTPRSRKQYQASEMSMIMTESPVATRPPSGYNTQKNVSDVFSTEPVPLKTCVAIDPRRHMSSIDFSGSESLDFQSSKKSFPNMVNQSQFTLAQEVTDNSVHTGRKHFHDSNQESTDEVHYLGKRQYGNVSRESVSDENLHGTGRRMYANTPTFEFGSDAPVGYAPSLKRRDPNARSEEHLLGITPSSR